MYIHVYTRMTTLPSLRYSYSRARAHKMSRQSLHLFTALEVAEELALRDAEMLRRIAPAEIRNGAWTESEKETLAPNVLVMVHAFNSLAQLVPTEILAEACQQQRAKVISAYIKIAKKCYKLRNYNSLNALLAGLLCTPVHRLKKTWKEVSSKRKKQLRYLTGFMSEGNNWGEYRRELARQTASKNTCVIFLGLLLSHAIHYESYQKLKRQNSRQSSHTLLLAEHKISICETFTVLEAITVRKKLENLRLSQTEQGGVRGRTVSRSRGPIFDESEESGVTNILAHDSVHTNSKDDDTVDEERLLLRSTSLCDPNGGDTSLTADRKLVDGEVCVANGEVLSHPHCVVTRGRSLDQLLQACQLENDPLTCDLEMAQSQSMPRLTSGGNLQLWADTADHQSHCYHDPTPHEVKDISTTTTAASKNDNSDCVEGYQVNDFTINHSTTVPEMLVSTAQQDTTAAPTAPNKATGPEMKRQISKMSSLLTLRAHARKRYTTSDEMDVLQLHVAMDKPSSDPAVLLKQYQMLSLGYSLHLTSSPYIRSLLENTKPTTDTHHYKQSYLLEPV